MLQSSNSDARPMSVYTTRGVRSRIEIIPLSASKGHFVALVKIQTLLSPISKRWVLQMQLPQGQSIDYTSNGHIVTHGSMVTINSNNPNDLSPKMALSMEIRGRYTGSYRLPNLSAAMVNNH
ncbi:hypothetical protein GGI25_006309 [Coemansia spiralis]|uniref:Uncharacterized protein n=2 Tax=Coemansia TaxID=4863 RepID=A0A9W8G2C5_9FUNG|nr:hypothetical protein EDC05_006280 [Coemansia umbellata]KAJ2618775.1 hypothetical protein GGI26_006361 [Coemansia sp. RSA 1358]KAJ2668928.1 hypothetical protein GGI25_006309 [Coemansia spiralis]